MTVDGATPSVIAGPSMLEVEDVHKSYTVRHQGRRATLRAVDGISFSCDVAEAIGVVGESGCGKTTLGRMVAGLVQPTSGRISARPSTAGPAQDGGDRGTATRIQMVYQNPAESLDPRWTISASVAEPLLGLTGSDSDALVRKVLQAVGLPEHLASRRPHQLSGGQQQRACIARALIAEPSMIVLDEAVSGLDVVLQRDVLDLLREVQERTSTSYLFISHDLAAVASLSNRILIMYLGRVVESIPARSKRYLHPYSVALHSAQLEPAADGTVRTPIVLNGDPPTAIGETSGCRFAPRCPLADERCRIEEPTLTDAGHGQLVACHHAGELTDTATD